MIDRIIHYFHKYPLARRVVFVVILWSLILTIIAAVGLTFFDYHKEINQLNSRLEQIKIIEVPSISNSLWHFDNEQIKTQLLGIINLQDLSYAKLDIIGAESIIVGQVVNPDKIVTKTIPIFYTQNEIKYNLGQLTVIADIGSLQNRVYDRLYEKLLSSAIQVFLLAGFILVLINRVFTRPLNKVVSYAESMDLDHLDQPLVIRSSNSSSNTNELDLVVLRLNEMRLRLINDIAEKKNMENALDNSERSYREIFNATSEAIIIHDTETGKILQVNTPMLHLYGYTSEIEVQNLLIEQISSNEGLYNGANAKNYLSRALSEGPQLFEWHARKKNGGLFWVELTLRSAMINGSQRILAVIRDITELKQNSILLKKQYEELLLQRQALEKAELQLRELNQDLEKRVEQRTKQLAEVNQELESFSYSVAHDLQSPLRSINAYSSMIVEEKMDCLDGESRDYFDKIQTLTRKMSTLIDDLLKLSRVTRSEINLKPVNLAQLAAEIIEGLKNIQPEREVEIIINPDLSTIADTNLISIAMDNLIRNAWKFTGKTQNARIEIGIMEKDGQKMFFVSDNGAGFDPKKATNMFIPFERFHPISEFEGTGIGLAITKRIINHHNGRIWAEGDLNQGAIFYFTLPD